MTRLIQDFVTTSSGAEFRNDVQLAQYRSIHNLELAKDFIFTRKAAPGRKSSIELLKYLCEAFMPGSPPNRFVYIATYGHGKSHLAVAIANYFGKDEESHEFQGVLERVRHAAESAPLVGFFEAFKRNHKPFLILILRGDEPSDLQTKFFRAVEEALQFDSPTNGVHAPFWYSDAQLFVRSILSEDQEKRDKANAFLDRFDLDLAVLLERITKQDAATYEITRELCFHLNHFSPDFGTGLGLKEGVEWLGTHLVGENKPYGGVLILFDEFSSFVWDYAVQIRHRPGAPLQDLLNGVESARGKVTFAALAQRDPELVAKSLLSGDSLQSVITQLNRLPMPQHYQLHSSLEEVLDAYLKQAGDTWAELLANLEFRNAIGRANDLSFDIFTSRYQEVLEWDIEHFQEVVTQGCFPLHPSTTALLSSVELETTSNPRSVLGFVHKNLELLHGKEVCTEGRPAWILPVALVDYFREMLGEKPWGDFCDALAQAGGPDATQDQVSVLKAMLLQVAGRVPTRGAYVQVIANFAGLDNERAREELQALATSGVIRFDSANRVYTFWPAGKGANKVDQLLLEKVRNRSLNNQTTDSIMKSIRLEGLFGNISVAVPWGHPEDWQAEQILMSRQMFTDETLRAKASRKMAWETDGSEGTRGLLVWLIAETPEDAAWFRDNVDSVIASAFPSQNMPIILMRPEAAEPEFSRQLLRLWGLDQFTNTDRAEVGDQQFQAVRQLTVESLKSGQRHLKDNAQLTVTAPFRARVHALHLSDPEAVLAEVFTMAYSDGPKRWFTQYKLSSTRFRTSIARVTAYLLTNSLDTPGIFAQDSIGKDATQLIRSEWELLTSDLKIKKPQPHSKVSAGWDLLERRFPVGGTPHKAADALRQLLNLPYGYDYNTLSLLLAAWLGYYRHDLIVSLNGALQSIKLITKDSKPKEFVELVASLVIKRTDANVVRNKVHEILNKVDRGPFSKEEAQEALQVLSEANDREDIDQKTAVTAATGKLQHAINAATAYDDAALKLLQGVPTSTNIVDLVRLVNAVKKMNMPGIVRPEQPAPAELLDRVLGRITTVTKQHCEKYQQLKSVADYRLNEQQLKATKKTVADLQLPEMISMVDEALTALDNARKAIENNQHDENTLALLRSIEEKGKVSKLNELITRIKGMSFYSTPPKQLAEEKMNALAAEVERLVSLAAGIPTRLSIVRDSRSLDEVQSDILRHVNLYEGSAFASQVEGSLEQCRLLKTFLESVERLRRDAVDTPAAAQERVVQLNRLKQEYGSQLSEAQESLIAAVVSGIEEQASTHVQAAVQWLGECESSLKSGQQLGDLAQRLQSPPAFLPEEQRSRLESLIDQVRRQSEHRQQEAAAIATIKSVSAKGSVEELSKQVVLVESVPLDISSVGQLAEEKLSAIRNELNRLESYREGIPARLSAVRDLRSLDGLQSDILRHVNLYEGSAFASQVEGFLEQCRLLKTFLESVERLRRDAVDTPAAAQERVVQLNRLKQEYGSQLSEAQESLIAAVVSGIEEQASTHVQAAVQWLGECESSLKSGQQLGDLAQRLQSPPAFLPEEQRSRLESLIDQVRRQSEHRQQEAAAIATIKSVSAKGSVEELSKQVVLVESVPLDISSVGQLAEEKLSAIRNELNRLESYREGIPARLSAVRDLRSLDGLQSDILRHVNLYEGSAFASQVEGFLEQCRLLKTFLESVERLRRDPIISPVEAQERMSELNRLAQDHRSQLGNGQDSLISKAIVEIEEQVTKQRVAATRWLEECEETLAGAQDLDALLKRLRSAPAFLSDDERPRLARAFAETSARIDDDQVLRVLVNFEQISNPHKRVECLDRIKALLERDLTT